MKNEKIQIKISKLLIGSFSILILFFLILPIIIVIPMSFSDSTSLQFPPSGFSFRWYLQVFTDSAWLSAIKTSFTLAIISSITALLIGSLASYALVRHTIKGKQLLQSNFIAPLIIPSVILSVALYFSLASIGLLGSFFGLYLSHTILGIPYVVLIMSVAIANFDQDIEQAAFTLGASWPTMFIKIMLPNLLPSALAAWIFAFVTSFDEVVVTKFIAGSYNTVPKKMFNELILQVNPAITALATVLISISLVLIILVSRIKPKTTS